MSAHTDSPVNIAQYECMLLCDSTKNTPERGAKIDFFTTELVIEYVSEIGFCFNYHIDLLTLDKEWKSCWRAKNSCYDIPPLQDLPFYTSSVLRKNKLFIENIDDVLKFIDDTFVFKIKQFTKINNTRFSQDIEHLKREIVRNFEDYLISREENRQ